MGDEVFSITKAAEGYLRTEKSMFSSPPCRSTRIKTCSCSCASAWLQSSHVCSDGFKLHLAQGSCPWKVP